MTRECQITGRRPATGKSYAIRGIAKKKKGIGLKITGKTDRRFLPNVFKKRIWVEETKQFVKVRVSPAALRMIDKNGLIATLKSIPFAG